MSEIAKKRIAKSMWSIVFLANVLLIASILVDGGKPFINILWLITG